MRQELLRRRLKKILNELSLFPDHKWSSCPVWIYGDGKIIGRVWIYRSGSRAMIKYSWTRSESDYEKSFNTSTRLYLLGRYYDPSRIAYDRYQIGG